MDPQPSSFYGSILKSGLIIGVLDAIAASVNAYVLNRVSPAAVFRYVASGVFGKEAFAGNWLTACWGLLFHFIIATGWTALFFVIYPKLKMVTTNMIVAGIAYGVFVWLMMNLVVVPLSQVPPGPFRISRAVIMILIHMFVIGVPIAYLANKYYSMAGK